MIFLDTPGLLEPSSLLHETMARQIERSVRDADVVLLLLDAGRPADRPDLIHSFLSRNRTPVIAAVNKIDLLPSGDPAKVVERIAGKFGLQLVNPISARDGLNVDSLLRKLESALPAGVKLYPDEVLAEQPERFFVGELVRQAAFELLSEELPYAIAVEVDEFVDPTDPDGGEGPEDGAPHAGKTYIGVIVYVEKESQKGIVIGRKGSMLRQIGRRARTEIELLLGCEVYLDLWVKVRRDWRNRERDLNELGYR